MFNDSSAPLSLFYSCPLFANFLLVIGLVLAPFKFDENWAYQIIWCAVGATVLSGAAWTLVNNREDLTWWLNVPVLLWLSSFMIGLLGAWLLENGGQRSYPPRPNAAWVERATLASRAAGGRCRCTRSLRGGRRPGPDVAAVEQERGADDLAEASEVGLAQLVPLGDEDDRVGAFGGGVGVVDQGDAVAKEGADVVGRDRVVADDGGAEAAEVGDDVEGRGLADVVGLGLEGQAPDRDTLAGERAAEAVGDARGEGALGALVGLDGGFDDAEPDVVGAAMSRKARRSLGKHEPPKPMPGNRNFAPMRGSLPTPLRTFSMSAPSLSARAASSFMNEMRVASMALAAYLVSSAERRSMTWMRSLVRRKPV